LAVKKKDWKFSGKAPLIEIVVDLLSLEIGWIRTQDDRQRDENGYIPFSIYREIEEWVDQHDEKTRKKWF
jgi:hypothetical protein